MTGEGGEAAVLLERYVAIDLETTGGDPADDRIMEMAAVLFAAGQPVASRSWLCDPGRPIPLRFQTLTGITPELVRGRPPAEAVLPEVLAFAGGAPLVAHNAAFDGAFLRAAARRAGLDATAPLLDALELARIAFPLLRNHRLGSLCRRLGIALDGAHRAEADALACGQVFARALSQVAALEPAILVEVLRLAPYDWPLRPVFAAAVERAQLAGQRPRPAGEWIRPAPGSIHSPEEPDPPADAAQAIDPAAVAAILGPGGPVATAFAQYEHRPQQMELARQVAAAFNDGHHLLMEAGTGTGKSLAYLVPALLWARANDGRVVVSTHTITLQEQLWEKDIPFLLQALGWDVPVALAKGRNNYVCLRKWQEQVTGADFGTTVEERQFLIRTLPWLAETVTGDRGELGVAGAAEEFWRKIQSEGETCLGPRCPWYNRHCFAFRARQQAKDAAIIVANHALVCADLKAGGGILPRYRHLILDEAHHLEAVATEHLGTEVAQRELLGTLLGLFRGFRAEAGPGLLPQLKKRLGRPLPARPPAGQPHEDLVDKLIDLVLQAREQGDRLFAAVAAVVEGLGGSEAESGRTLRLTPAVRAGGLWEEVERRRCQAGAALRRLAEGLAHLAEALEDLPGPGVKDREGTVAELAKQAGALHQAAADLDAILGGDEAGMVYWAEVAGGAAGREPRVRLRAAPIHVGGLLREQLFDKLRAVVMTSATLAVQGSFDHFRQRLGLADLGPERLRSGAVPSPFRYQEQALVLIPADAPNPKQSERDYTRAVQEFLAEFLVAVGGRTLVLFTSHRQLRQVHQELKPDLENQGLLLLAQGVDGSRGRLVEEFKTGERAVLFGSNSFWEGVDIPGAVLSCVVMVRLPFTPPGDPVQEARLEDLERRGLSPFFHLSLPQAVIRFKQGFGRLIRTGTDRGVVVIFDNRVDPSQTRYGQRFLQSLPRPRVVAAPRAQVVRLASEFLRDRG